MDVEEGTGEGHEEGGMREERGRGGSSKRKKGIEDLYGKGDV